MDRRATDGRSSATKRALLAVSRSLEEFATRAAASDIHPTVIALFEDAIYFEHERDRYEAMAGSATVIVGFAGEPAAPLPDGLIHLALPQTHELSKEWTVLVMSVHGSGAVVADDLQTAVQAESLERGRVFAPDLATEPTLVAHHARRIVASAGELLPADVAAVVRAQADQVVERGAGPCEQVLAQQLRDTWWRLLSTTTRLEQAERTAFTDPLTGAFNRRFLDHYLQHAGTRAPMLAAAAFDMDGFKEINDRWGHAAGDEALRTFADLARRCAREGDPLFRTGGDEWLLLFPGLSLDIATQRVQQLLDELRTLHLARPAHRARLRASAGVGVFPASGLDLEALDRAMYASKSAGEGQVRLVGDDEPTEIATSA